MAKDYGPHSKGPTGTPSGRPNPHTDTGYSHSTPVNTSTNTGGNGNNTVTTGGTGGTGNGSPDYKDVPFKNPFPTIGPLTILGNMGAKHAYKSRQKFARKEGLYRDYYRANKKPLQPNSPLGKKYLKEAGYGKTTPTSGGRGNNVMTCPDGTPPPCGSATPTKPKSVTAPYKPYYMGFDFQKPMDASTHRALPMKKGGILKVASKLKKASKAHASQAQTLEKLANMKKGGLSGGKRYGPPPKKGPNPHGKCPFREDGIRGVGAVQPGRGVKFVGVK
tara:strand:+ start:321 stop:1148 length:828 start_codon:yes stop_codon:yes gene_type:complete